MSEDYNLSKPPTKKFSLKLGPILILLVFLGLLGLLRQKAKFNINTPSVRPTETVQNTATQEAKNQPPRAIADNIRIFEIGPEGKLTAMEINVPINTALMWKNTDTKNHELIFIGEKVKSNSLKTGDSFTRMFNEAGTYRFALSDSPEKVGVINVK